MMGKEGLAASLISRWREFKSSDGGFFIAWRLITFLLAFLGFLALASTGELHPAVIISFITLWISAFFTVERPDFWRDWMGRGLVWVALALIGAVALRGKFASVLYLMLFLTIYKCFTLHEAIDHLHALIMAFFMFLACSIISASIVYLGFLFLFIILMMLDMICLTIAREGARIYTGFGTMLTARLAGTTLPVWRRLFLSSLIIGTIVLAMTITFFLMLPHYTVNRLANPWIRAMDDTARFTGYSDDINFSNLKQLKLDDTIVMSVRPSWKDGVKRPFPAGLRLRGQSLDKYSESGWSASEHGSTFTSTQWKVINLQPLPADQGPVLIQHIQQNVYNIRRLFGASMPFRFDLPETSTRRRWRRAEAYQYDRSDAYEPYKMRLDWRNGGIQIIPITGWGLTTLADTLYAVQSHLTEDALPLMRAFQRARLAGQKDPTPFLPSEIRMHPSPGLTLSAGQKLVNTYMPQSDLSLKLGRISREIASGPEDYDRITELINWFYTKFEYSLTPETKRGVHPLEVFLTLSHRGHCEYFASAFVLLLRAQGIPARIATGFYTNELSLNGDESIYTVRQSDAHAWAEVWMNGYGWLTFDPTPPDWRGRTTRLQEQPSLWAQVSSWSRAAWQRYVLDYSQYQQQAILSALMGNRYGRVLVYGTQSAIETTRNLLLLNKAGNHLSNREIYTRSLLLLIALLLAMVLLFEFLTRSRRQARGPVLRSSVGFMNQLIGRLNTLGWKRAHSQTPAEWIGEIERQTQGRWQLRWILDLYHRCRFAHEAPSHEEELRARDIIRQLR